MADSKITALTAISTVDPTADPLVIVDVSDTSMAASGTTKKSTINQLLGAGGTATLASATITGDLTVDTNVLKVDTTNNVVGIGTSTPNSFAFNGPAELVVANNAASGDYCTLTVASGSTGRGYLAFANGSSGTNRYNGSILYDHTSNYMAFQTTAGAEQMRLNATGLGVGVVPAVAFDVQGTSPMARVTSTSTTGYSSLSLRNTGASGRAYGITVGGSGTGATAAGNLYITDDTASATRLVLDASGNVGIGVTPSAWASSYKALQFGQSASVSGFSSELAVFGSNCYFDTTDSRWERITSGFTSQYYQTNGTHVWRIGGTAGANTDCSFTQAMTLDASGNLLVGTTTPEAKLTVLAGASGQAAIFQQPAQNFWCVLAHNQATSGDNSFVLFGTEASFTSRGSITYNRAAGQVSYNITSDYRLKEDVKPLTGALNRISSLKPSTYKFKETGFTCEGFIAHELAEVIPAAVTGEKDAVNEDGSIKAQGVDLSKVVPILVAAIQELTAEVNALKNA